MNYKKLNIENAKEFKEKNLDYNIYIYNPKLSVLSKIVSGGDFNYLYSYSYLINSNESNIKLTELDKKNNDYNVIFIEPDDSEILEEEK